MAEGLCAAGLQRGKPEGVSLLLELDGPSCEALEEVSPIGMSPHGSGEGCHLFGLGDHLGTGLGEVTADGCSSARSILVSEADGGNGGDCPNRMWQEAVRFSLRGCGGWSRMA